MLEFESEFTNLMQALWDVNKQTSNPYLRWDLARAVTSCTPKFDYPRPDATAAAAKDLERRGFHRLGQVFDSTQLGAIKAKLEGGRLYDSQALSYVIELVDTPKFAFVDRPSDVFIANYEFEAVIRCTPLLQLACNPRIVATVEAYIGCTPTISAFAVWHSFPGQVDAPAERFHRDRDDFRFTKLFVYLTDVDARSGPHEFIQYSHNPDALQSYFQSSGVQVDLPQLFNENSRDLRHEDLKRLLGRNIVVTTGPAGFGFLEDTYGLHRGTRPQTSPRLIFSVTYTGLPLRYSNKNDRANEMSRKLTFADAGMERASELERYLLRYMLR